MTGFGYNISGFGAFASRGVELEVSASSASTLNVKTLFDNDTAGSYAGSANKILTIGGSVAEAVQGVTAVQAAQEVRVTM